VVLKPPSPGRASRTVDLVTPSDLAPSNGH
jgi:hypothetical protein